MTEILHKADSEALFCLWATLDSCAGCRDDAYALSSAPPPARPYISPRDGSILFIGEAPPEDGGFWRPGNGDGLRRRLLPCLPAWSPAIDCDSPKALEWFVDAGHFFVQAVKWPLSESYNAQRRAPMLALQHAVTSHLESEIELINPQHIVALGAAARDACAALSERRGLALPLVGGTAAVRLNHYVFRMATGREVPLHVTRLPGKRNEGFGWTRVIGHDVAVFLACKPNAKSCEQIDRLPSASGRRAPQANRREEAKLERQLLRRLKRVHLWPIPAGRSFDEIVAELQRRETRAPPATPCASGHEWPGRDQTTDDSATAC